MVWCEQGQVNVDDESLGYGIRIDDKVEHSVPDVCPGCHFWRYPPPLGVALLKSESQIETCIADHEE